MIRLAGLLSLHNASLSNTVSDRTAPLLLEAKQLCFALASVVVAFVLAMNVALACGLQYIMLLIVPYHHPVSDRTALLLV